MYVSFFFFLFSLFRGRSGGGSNSHGTWLLRISHDDIDLELKLASHLHLHSFTRGFHLFLPAASHMILCHEQSSSQQRRVQHKRRWPAFLVVSHTMKPELDHEHPTPLTEHL